MSVEFSIYVRFQSIQDPVERFLEIVSQFQATGHYGQLHRLYVDDILYQHPPQPRKGKRHNPEYDRNRHTLLSRDTFKGDSLSVAQLPNLLASFRGEGM